MLVRTSRAERVMEEGGDVVGEQRDHLIDLAALKRIGEATDQLPLLRRPGNWSVVAGARPPGVQRRPRPLQRAVDGGLAGFEHVGDLVRAESQHVPQDERRALARRQALNCRHEGE